jgi:hypothetical protein
MERSHRSLGSLWLATLAALGVGLVAVPAEAVVIHANGNVWSLNSPSTAPARNFFLTRQASDGSTANTWVTEAGGADYFAGYPNGQPVLLMDLGADVTINSAAFWNYSTSNANNTRTFSLRFATASEGPLGMSRSIAYNPTFNPIFGGPGTQENLAFAAPLTARYVQMRVTDNYGGVNVPPVYPGGDRVGFADIAFDVAAAPTYQASATRTRPTCPVTDPASNGGRMFDGLTGTEWYTVTTGGGTDYFVAGTPPVLTIDLGRQQTMNGFTFRNYSVAGNRTKDFSLLFATEAEGPANVGTSIPYNPSFTAANLDQNQLQAFGLSAPLSARYVRMTITDNYSGDRVGFTDIQFRDSRPSWGIIQIVSPVSAASSTAANDYWPVANLIDGNPGTTWVTSDEGSGYFDNRHAPILTFDLGRNLDLCGLDLQNYPVPGNALKDFALTFAAAADGPNGFGTSVGYSPIFQILADSSLTQRIFFDQVVNARYVQFLALGNYDDWGSGGGDRVGFAEIQFLVHPEPGTLSLLGLGALALLRRRRARA